MLLCARFLAHLLNLLICSGQEFLSLGIFFLCSFHSWNGGPVKKTNWGLISLSVVTLSPPRFLFVKYRGRDKNIIVWEDRWAWGSCYKKLQVEPHLFPLSYVLLFFTRPPRAASCSHFFFNRGACFGAAGDKNKCPIRGVLTICSQTVLRPSSKKTQIRGGCLNVKLWVVWIYWATCGFQFLGFALNRIGKWHTCSRRSQAPSGTGKGNGSNCPEASPGYEPIS